MYYVFYKPTKEGICFQKFSSLNLALSVAEGQEKRVFQHIKGIPNPFWMHPIKNGKIDTTKIFKEIPLRSLAQLKPLRHMPFNIKTGKYVNQDEKNG